ncbi:TonB-dependent receptor [Nitrospira tepida]|uniref:TonB-dependent receptor n=2 Tax=Nitrospira tepida TaxID=2973512 RepID=A0AA86MWV0_9BACT|nr:TonB-dependent receptor [Nitrospira tepida]
MMNGALGRGCRWALLAAAVTCVCMSFPSEVWSASEEAPLVEVAPVEVRGQRIENVNDVKKEFARRPASNILIEEKQITESRALNLQDVLQFAPGVRFQSRFGADEGQFQIRGTSLRNNFHHRGINILINGIFFGDADGFSDFESIDLLAYERIEVYKGANALRYGANAIGGAINFVPRTGYSASQLQMRFIGGSFGMVSGQVSSGKVTQPFKVGHMDATMDYYVSVSANHQDGFQSNSQQSRERVNANIGLQLGSHQEMRTYFLQANVAERLPGALTTAQLFADRRQAGGQTTPPLPPPFFACVQNNQTCNWGRYYNLQRIGMAYRNEFAANQFLEIIPYYSYQYLDHPIFQTIKQDNNNVGGEVRYRNANHLFGRPNVFVVGVQPRYGDQHQWRLVNINGNNGAMTQNAHIRTTYFGAYAEDQFDATEALTIVLGGRWDYSGRQANIQNFGPAGNPFDPSIPSVLTNTQQPLQHFDAINPKLGFVYRTSSHAQLYFNASRAYEAPLNVELTSANNPDGSPNTGFLNLDAQRAWQFEIGHRGKAANGRYFWDITAYDLEMQKEIITNLINNNNTFRNANATRHTGVEAGGAVVVARGLWANGPGQEADQVTMRAAYTWSLFKFTDDVYGATTTGGPNVLIARSGNRIAGAPEHSLAYEVRYDHPKGWWVAPNFEWVPSGFYVNYLNTVKNPSYFVLHLKSGWNITPHLTLYAEARNLTDKTYAGAVTVNDPLFRYANVAQGISGYAGLEYKF